MPAAKLVLQCAAIVLLAAAVAYPQSGGQSGSTGTKTGTTRMEPPPLRQERRPLYISGRVVLEGGTVPSERVAIERVCHGHVRREGYTDSRGQFGFQMGSELQLLQDASIGSADMQRNPAMSAATLPSSGATPSSGDGVTQQELMICELRATLPGYHSDSVSLAGRQIFDHPEVGVLVLHPMSKVEGTSVSASTMSAPKEAKKAFERGSNMLKKNKPAEAAAEFSQAIALYPKFAEALARLGEIYSDQNRPEDAAKLLHQAMEVDPKYVAPYVDLARLAGRKQDWTEMAKMSERAIELNPYEYPAAYFFHAIANFNLLNLEAAEKSARAANRLDPQNRNPRIDYLLANILFQKGDYAGAAEQVRTFLQQAPGPAETKMGRDLLAQIESKRGASKQ